ncbi:MAG: pyruvate synthase [Nitrospinae bacterium]|nr:pyruvate synthase [Nitrospinota bacterium]
MCGGCGGLEVLRLAAKVLGERVVFVNAAGCFTLLALFPHTPFRGSWLYTTMGSAPAGAQGVRDALDVLLAKGKLQPEDDVQVVVVAGDGSTYDMALSATSGTLFRNLDYWYICYDNEAYGNTGMQPSSATPAAARSATTPQGGGAITPIAWGKKDLFEIWRAHRPPYLATVAPRHPVDLSRKFEKAKQFKGPKLFLAFSPCPTGWGYDPAQTQAYARLGVECGLFPLKEAVYGEVTHTYIRRTWRPVEAYLQGQRRFQHLFDPVRQDAIIRNLQEGVDRYWAGVQQ